MLQTDIKQLQVHTVTTLAGLMPHSKKWNNLTLSSSQQLPMLSYAWLSSYFEECLEAGESWVCLFAYEGSELVGVLPLVITPRVVLGWQRPLLRIPSHSQTFSVDILVAPGKEDQVIPDLIAEVRQLYPQHLGIEFKRLPEDSPTIKVLSENRLGGFLHQEFCAEGAYLKVPDSFEQYRASLSGNFRSNLNKASRKLNKLNEVQIKFLHAADATEQDLPKFMAVEAASWKGNIGTAILNSPEDVSFYTTLTRRFSEAGWLEWQFIEADGKTISGNMAFRLNRSIVVWKLGYDSSYSKCSPGGLLFEQLVKLACESGEIDEINLMTDHTWYNDWKMERRKYFTIRLYQRHMLALLFEFLPLYVRSKARLYVSQDLRQSLRKIVDGVIRKK